MAKAQCSRTDYKYALNSQLDLKAAAVKAGMEDNAVTFPSPPVGAPALEALIIKYQKTLSAYSRGGADQKPAFDTTKKSLRDALDKNADYVDSIANGRESIIVLGGYVPTKTKGSPVSEPAIPEKIKVKRGEAIGDFFVECPAQKEAMFYGLIVSEGVPLSNVKFNNGQLVLANNLNIVLDVSQSRKKHIRRAKPGVMYYFYMYAGNRNGTSPLSIVRELMAA